MLGGNGVSNFGSTVLEHKYFLFVFRDSPVRRAISRIGNCSRNAIRLMMFESPTWIAPLPLRLDGVGEGSHEAVLDENYAPNRVISLFKSMH